MSDVIKVKGVEVYKIQTLVDRGIRLTLDLSEDAVPQAAQLMLIRQAGMPVTVTIEPEE